MVMGVARFVAQFRQIRDYLEGHPDASDDLRAAFTGLSKAFKAAYTPEALKAALGEDSALASDLEERITSAVILLNRERARSSGSG